ncbi:cytochrome P450 78A7-like [Nicotiana tomentosiformis]|uniref:cytochrome P450 78A7-like n=1 Tax=Nicotiana tomentosiformis TaxID=4098 RepID=UPI00051ACF92|nr:cytochrome P450 78A7-like [Nicotiana tomentosiformis]XP_009597743.1 cytochrome P450 78A7-like [Nicotiana tomentosiformis]
MDLVMMTKDSNWWVFTLPAFLGSKTFLDEYVIISIVLAFLSITLITWACSPGGVAWKNGRNHSGKIPIPGPRGFPIIGSLFTLSRGLAHRSLASAAWTQKAKQLMAFSLGSTPVVVSSDPQIAKEILTSPQFADRPIKQSAKSLMFSRAIGFAPNGTYWRLLRRIASSHLFAPKRIAAHETGRQLDCSVMIRDIVNEQLENGTVSLRKHLQLAALNNIMGSVFGKRYNKNGKELKELQDMVKEGFELLGAFNWSDYLPWLRFFYDPSGIVQRCEALVPRVRKLVKAIIEEHRCSAESKTVSDNADFVDVLLSLDGAEELEEDDMVAVLWEMIFRGTDTTALLTEWVMAELILHPKVLKKLQKEVDDVTMGKAVTDADVARMPYLQAIVKETLRVHPPGPLLSWARLSTTDVQLSNGMVVPSHTAAMVNMWAITHDSDVWENPLEFKPERFMEAEGGANVDVRGGDLRLAPFGAGRRVCPGKNLGLVIVMLWVAKLLQNFEWVQDEIHPVDLEEVLKLSCEMKNPLVVMAIQRNVPF